MAIEIVGCVTKSSSEALVMLRVRHVYLAHNHPSGNCTPSRQDIQTTKEIELALSGIDVILSDHFIFTDEDYLSMRATGVLQKLRHDIATLKRQIIT